MLLKKVGWVASILVTALLLTACSGGNNSSGDPVAMGKELFDLPTLGTAAGCKTCHSLEPETTIIGPSLAQIGAVAGSRVPGMTAQDYLKQSIFDPNSFIVDGYPASVMPNVYAEQLTEDQVEQLIAYMLSLAGDSD